MKKYLLITLILSLFSLYGCMEATDTYSDKTTEEGLTAEKIFNKTNEGMDANNEANKQLQDLSDQVK